MQSVISEQHSSSVLPQPIRSTDDRSPFNPVIILRGPTNTRTVDSVNGATGFEIYYNDGVGSGLRPLPLSMSDFLLGSGFHRLINQLTQIEANGFGRVNQNAPASKDAVETLPVIEIQEVHMLTDSYCAVCKERFELKTEAKELPCKHLYHSECILPWLKLRNSCPVCRHELPSENEDSGCNEEAVGLGLMIWRLPGGSIAVGRRRVSGFSETDYGLDVDGGSVRGLSANVGRWRRVFGGMFSCFGGRGSGLDSVSVSSSGSDDELSGGSRFIPAIFSGSTRPSS